VKYLVFALFLTAGFSGLFLAGSGTSLALSGGVDWVANGVSAEMTNSGEVNAVVFGDRDKVNGDEILLQYEGFETANREVNISIDVRGENDGDSVGWDGGAIGGATSWETVAKENVTVSNLSGSVRFGWSEVFGKDRPVNVTGNHSEIQPSDFEASGVGKTRTRELGVRIRAEAPAEGVSDNRTTTALVVTSRVGVDINFENGPQNARGDPETDTPEGFVRDGGGLFGDRNGLTYGWTDPDGNPNRETRERNSTPDTKNDTLVHFANDNIAEEYDSTIHPYWSVSLPNGTYNVTFVAGDPDNTDSEHTFDVNGRLFQDPENNGGQNRNTNFVRYEGQVAVTDGNMRFEPPDGAYNPKLNWVRIRTTELDEPFFDVRIDGTNSPQKKNNTVLVNYTVENTGLEAGTQNVSLSVEGKGVVDTAGQSLGVGKTATGTLEWNTTPGDEGNFGVNVSSEDSSDTDTVVVGDAFFDVNITGTNSPQNISGTIEVDYRVENTGATNGTQFIDLFVDGNFTDTKQVTLNASEAKTGTLEWNTGPGDGGVTDVSVATEDTSDNDTVFVGSFPIQINFEPPPEDTGERRSGYQTPDGFTPDQGGAYGERNNLTYGWFAAGTRQPTVQNQTRDRDAGGVSTENDTLNHFVDNPAEAYDSTSFFWGIELPDGEYEISVVGGDADFLDQNITYRIGDKLFLDEEFNNGNRPDNFLRHDGTVNVTGGNLTVEPPTGTFNPKINWIRIEKPSEPFYDVNITQAPTDANVGENITVEAEVKNTGNETNLQDITFSVNGTVEDTKKDRGVMPGSSINVSFNYTVGMNDTPAVDVAVSSDDSTDSSTVTVTKLAPAFFDVTIDGVNNSVVEGKDVVVNYTVNNTGEVQDTQSIDFRVNGSVNDTSPGVNLVPGGSFSGSFSYTTGSMDKPGISVKVSSDNDTANGTVTVNESQAGQVALTPNVKSTGNSGKYEYELNNTGTINVTVVGIGVRSTTANADRVQKGGTASFIADGNPVVPNSEVVPIDGSTIVGHDPVEINTGAAPVVFEFDRFVDAGGKNVKMKGQEVTVEVEFSDGSFRTYSLIP
jgi:hypothetical protein